MVEIIFKSMGKEMEEKSNDIFAKYASKKNCVPKLIQIVRNVPKNPKSLKKTFFFNKMVKIF